MLVVVACGGAEGDVRPVDRSREPASQPDGRGAPQAESGSPRPTPRTKDPSQSGRPVGQIVRVIESLARVGGERIGGGDALFRGSELSTDARGRATFTVAEVLEDCQVQTDSKVTVAPAPRTPLKVDQGSIICRSKPGQEEFEVPAGDAIAAFLDPIFLIDVRGGRTQVRVDHGFLQVRKAGRGSKTLLVGPGAELTVGSGALPNRAEAFDAGSLDRFNAEARARMQEALPPDPRGFPNTGKSEALRRIGSAGSLNAAFDDSASRPTGQFGREVFGLLAGYWRIGADVDAMAHRAASSSLQSGIVDAFVSPEPVPGAAGISLFGDEAGRTWSLWVSPDDGLEAAIEDLLKIVLNNGDYGRAYLETFGRVPQYEVVRSLVYPTPQEAGRSQWQEPTGAPDPPPSARVGKVTLSASESEYSGPCPVDITFSGEIVVESPGTVDYEFLLTRSSGGIDFSAGDQLHAKGTLLAERPGPVKVEETLTVTEGEEGWMSLRIPAQNLQSPKATYVVGCTKPSAGVASLNRLAG